jgi:two-component system, chemotaxis family, CheB/CheR fusion protein
LATAKKGKKTFKPSKKAALKAVKAQAKLAKSPSDKTVKRRKEKAAPVPQEAPKDGFYIVGIGASAGGLDAIEKFLKNMPEDSGMSFVLVPHLDPRHKSMMVDLLKRYTKMDIFQARENVKVKQNAIYIIPPDREMVIRDGRLRLFEISRQKGLRHPIDAFFRSLAEDQGEFAVGVVLSGTGTEGALGLRDIKGAGGLAVVQDPATATYSGMPENAIATGVVDYVLPPEKMAVTLMDYIRQSGRVGIRIPEKEKEEPKNLLKKVIGVVRAQTGVDFSLYKTNTIVRRIEKRMAMHQITEIEDYLTYLRNSPHEINSLLREILIRVTNFFRDADAFDIMKNEVIPRLIVNKSEENPLRIWVPGCSTGEEVYSLAIIVREVMQQARATFPVQIFATDIDAGAIEIARLGVYTESITADVSPERLSRYFLTQGGGYKLRGEIREMVVFAVHNILKDPPFLKLDLVSFRNVLIYMGSELQKKVIPLLRYTLNNDGILLLGPSENIGDFSDLFTVVDKKWKIFRARKGEKVVPAHIGVYRPFARETAPPAERPVPNARTVEVSLEDFTEDLLLTEYAPSCVIVNEHGDVVYFHGKTGKYLEPPSGRASLKVVDMAREGLRLELMSALRKAFSQKEDICSKALPVKTNGGTETIDLDVRYLSKPAIFEGLVMVVFKPVPTPKDEKSGGKKSRETERLTKHVSDLEYELKSTREHLQTTIEELETSNEELKSANEELQSSNEELQSTNEELETSREELQSMNEELVTVNSELQDKIEELSHANNDMKNLLASTRIATIFLDNSLKIKGFTPAISEIANLIQTDVGRPLSDISLKIDYPGMVADATKVIKSLIAEEKTVRHEGGGWYLAKMLPYRTTENIIEGAILTFIDTTAQHETRDELLAARVFENVAQNVREPILLLGEDRKVEFANRAFYSVFRVSPSETLNREIYSLGNGQWNMPELKRLLEEMLPKKKRLSDYRMEHNFQHIGTRVMILNATVVAGKKKGQEKGQEKILLTVTDVTEKK